MRSRGRWGGAFKSLTQTVVRRADLQQDLQQVINLGWRVAGRHAQADDGLRERLKGDRKSTRLNSSHLVISYAVFCLKKKKKRWEHVPRESTIKQRRDVDKCLSCSKDQHSVNMVQPEMRNHLCIPKYVVGMLRCLGMD